MTAIRGDPTDGHYKVFSEKEAKLQAGPVEMLKQGVRRRLGK